MTVPMSVLVGIDITDAKLTSSTAAEPSASETAWNAATSYVVGDEVIRTTTHRRYSNLIAGVSAALPEDSPLIWYDLGPTNRWAMLDGETSTQTLTASPGVTVLHPGHCNAAYLGGLDADSLTISVKDAPAGAVIFTQTISLEASAPDDYYEFFYDPYKPLRDALISGIDPYSDMQLSFTLTSGSGTVGCSVLRVGDLRALGQTLKGAKAKPKSYSRIKIDDEGNNKIVRGKKAKDISASALVAISEANTVLETITDLLDIPCVLICTDSVNYAGLRGYGLISGELSYDGVEFQNLSVTMIGLI